MVKTTTATTKNNRATMECGRKISLGITVKTAIAMYTLIKTFISLKRPISIPKATLIKRKKITKDISRAKISGNPNFINKSSSANILENQNLFILSSPPP
ncbi:MAG: hypothetical protein UR65_C0071G0004 [Candidatus Moranbacteria bacterium GW2011_GWE2_35_164]|nr:MAG: hypothetical protein UR65_C0071G0004 [Candidatus Moranbacteria bacterium GW2011_GWE2_35_164]